MRGAVVGDKERDDWSVECGVLCLPVLIRQGRNAEKCYRRSMVVAVIQTQTSGGRGRRTRTQPSAVFYASGSFTFTGSTTLRAHTAPLSCPALPIPSTTTVLDTHPAPAPAPAPAIFPTLKTVSVRIATHYITPHYITYL